MPGDRAIAAAGATESDRLENSGEVRQRIWASERQQSGAAVVAGDGDAGSCNLVANGRARHGQHVTRDQASRDLHRGRRHLGVVGIRDHDHAGIDGLGGLIHRVGQGATCAHDRFVGGGGDVDFVKGGQIL